VSKLSNAALFPFSIHFWCLTKCSFGLLVHRAGSVFKELVLAKSIV